LDTEKTPGRAWYDRQIAMLTAMDLDGIMSQYTDDAVMLRFEGPIIGKAALRKHFEGYLAFLGTFELISTDKYVEAEDSLFFEATVHTATLEARVYDAFMLRDGQAYRHFTGLLGATPLNK